MGVVLASSTILVGITCPALLKRTVGIYLSRKVAAPDVTPELSEVLITVVHSGAVSDIATTPAVTVLKEVARSKGFLA